MGETLTVQQLNERVRSLLSSSPGVRDVWVTGEISNLRCYPSGHYYFTLKDGGSEISCTLFKGSRARMAFEPKDNMKVAAFGRTDIYMQRGQYQFIVENMRRSGVGDLYLKYEELKKKLETEGLFEQSRKRPLPRYPRTIGVVTSPAGAVIHDIVTVSGRRFPADILLYPALVQGDGAPASIIRGIKALNAEDVDVMIVGRGGGSIEDLWAFNDEGVARAIASSRVPVISAVGHETDFTIADLVADLRAATPSAAAEAALPDLGGVNRELDNLGRRMSRSLGNVITIMQGKFREMDAKLSPRRAKDMVDLRAAELNGLSMRADSSLKGTMGAADRRFGVVDARLSPKRALETVDQYLMKMDDISQTMDRDVIRMIGDRRRDIETMTMRLDGLNPSSVLGRGYAIVRGASGRTLTSVSGMAEGDAVDIRMRDGTASAEIRKVTEDGR